VGCSLIRTVKKILTICVLNLVFLGAAIQVQAATLPTSVPELQALVQSLQSKITELSLSANAVSAELAPGTLKNTALKPARVAAPLPTLDVLKPSRFGEYSDSVRVLQTELTARGYYDGPTTGRYAQKTREAVLRFMKENNIPGDGRVVSALMITRIIDSLCVLDISVKPVVPAQEITVGAKGVTFAKVTLTAPKTCGVTVTKLTASVDTKGLAVQNVAENLALYNEEVLVGKVIEQPSWVNTFDNVNLSIPQGTKVTLTLKSDVVGVGNGGLRLGLSYIDAVKSGTNVHVGNKKDYYGEWMKVVEPKNEDSSADSTEEDIEG
jgi:peptidoglycan hydrolase-like protein with peptidoglycan-binding domain